MATIDLSAASRIFGDDLLAPEDVGQLLGGTDTSASTEIPIAPRDAEAARSQGCLLVYRPARLAGGEPLTLAALHARCAALRDDALRFAPEDPWFLSDPFASAETPEPGWAMVARAPWSQTLSRTYVEADAAIVEGAAGKPWRRRRAVEAALDCLAFMKCRGERLLVHQYDWGSTASADGGLVAVGDYDAAGLRVLAYSPPVQYGGLGVCPTLVCRG